MHDTPSQSLFGRNFRAASSGCVRVHGIEQLAAWVLADQGWKPEHIKQMKETGERRDVTLEEADAALFRLHHGLGDARTASCNSAATSTKKTASAAPRLPTDQPHLLTTIKPRPAGVRHSASALLFRALV